MSDEIRNKLAVGRQGRQLKNPMAGVSGRTVRKASGSKVQAGQYIRRTFTFREAQLARIKELAAEWNVSENDLARWLVDVGLEMTAAGRMPEVAPAGNRIVPE